MRININQAIVAGVGLLACGLAGGEEVVPLSLGNCVSALSEEGRLGIEICEAKSARLVIRPGRDRCVTSSRVMRGRAYCSKSDAATAGAGTGVVFTPHTTQPAPAAPAAIGSVEDFYVNRRAGDNRFRITRGDNGRLKVEKSGDSGWTESCAFGWSGSNVCASFGSYRRTPASRYIGTYTLQLDGLLVENKRQSRFCMERYKRGTKSCRFYAETGVQLLYSQLYPWN